MTSGTPVSAAGSYTLVVTATALVGNAASTTLSWMITAAKGIASPPFDFAICSFDSATLENNVTVRSYDRVGGKTGAQGHVAAQGDMALEDRATIYGSAVVGGNLSMDESAAILGDLYVGCPTGPCQDNWGHGWWDDWGRQCCKKGYYDGRQPDNITGAVHKVCPPPKPCECGYDLDGAMTYIASHNENTLLTTNPKISPWLKDGGLDIRGRATLTLPGGDFYLQYLRVTGDAQVEVTPGALVRLFVEGEVEVDGDAVLNASLGSGATLYVLSRAQDRCGDTVSISNREDGVLFVYAPAAEVNVDNRARLYGGIVGLDVDLENRGTMYGLNILPGAPQLVCPAQSYGIPAGGKARQCAKTHHGSMVHAQQEVLP